MAVNSISVSGNLGRDPEVKNFDSGSKVTKISIGVNCGYYDKKASAWKDNTAWLDVKGWNKLADQMAGFRKGDGVVVSGKLDSETWQDRETGKKQYKLVLVASEVYKIEKPQKGSSSSFGSSDGGFGGSDDDAFAAASSALAAEDSPF